MTNDCIVLNIGRRRQVVEFRQSKAEHILEPVGARLVHTRDETVEPTMPQRGRVEQTAAKAACPQPYVVAGSNDVSTTSEARNAATR